VPVKLTDLVCGVGGQVFAAQKMVVNDKIVNTSVGIQQNAMLFYSPFATNTFRIASTYASMPFLVRM
jgi:hypothetical protein